MFYLVVAASFQDIVETDEVALDVGVRVRNRITHTGLRREIHHHRKMMLREKVVDNAFVGNACFHEGPVAVQCLDFRQSAIFDVYIVIVCDRVYSDDFYVGEFIEKSLDQIAAYESGCTGHQNGFPVQRNIVFYHPESPELIPSEYIPGVNLIFHVIEAGVVAVRDDGL